MKTIFVAIGIALAASTAFAADLKIIVPYSAGGPTDSVVRVLAPALQAELGRTVIVDNRPGASGMIGMKAAATSAADGNTVVVGTQGQVLTALIQKSVITYDTLKDFKTVALIGETPSVLVVSKKLDVKTIDDLGKIAKEKTLHYASSGVGNSPHLAGEMMNSELGVKMVHVPYAGAAPAIVDLVAGNVDLMVADIAAVIGPIKAGDIKPVAILAPERSPSLPDIQTASEQGHAGLYTGGYYYVTAPNGISDADRGKLETAIIKVAKEPAIAEKLKTSGVGAPGTGAAMDKILADEFAKWGPIVQKLDIKIK
ncbi:tripartite tricarboxylate transporter substrate binding protein [Agrobacterium sp. T29]|uniref:Bug family tripartite tricarboxylate transporter substrate binding protein n=1 Tax=Agrobacterium sp. T29 TaxID=2580515 RepID=UPI00115DED32|nr:tripartite tricarboxylate transporter substrate binding protein [Agrobacterium sp. T29]